MTNYEKLIAVLEEIFQLNQADLDFGIYRILNQKREEITHFLQHRLIPQVKEIIQKSNVGDTTKLKKELEEAIAQAKSLGADPESLPRVQELRVKYQAAPPPDALENEIFSHLAAFFRRYYKDGDFISMRRYKKDVYAIPYEGEEVKLHWANHDQYYIKTSEHLKNYAFKLADDRLVRFELVEASTEKDNRKEESGKERRFRIFTEQPVTVEDRTLTVYFTYEPTDKKEKQEQLNDEAAKLIKKHLPAEWAAEVLRKKPTEKDKNRTLLDKHLKDFTARNTFDYFIHKDLGGFLSRELDFYIKNEVLHLDDIQLDNAVDFQQQLVKVQALRTIGGKIIAFLAQLEDFQKKLWLKKKFVVDTQYCITLDQVPEDFYPEIAANEAQREAWVQLFAIDELSEAPDGEQGSLFEKGFVAYSEPLTVAFLQSQPHLVLDTAFFSEDFKLRLVASFDNLDAQLDGLLINSENFQALGLLQERYREQVKCVYIDPPYNADATSILYKNEFRHSSWLSFIYDRIILSKLISGNESIFCVTIDDYEYHLLQGMFLEIFGEENHLATAIIRNNPSGRSTVSGFSVNHEYALFYSNGRNFQLGRLPHSKEQLARYDQVDEDNKPFEWENFRKSSAGSNRSDRPKQFYPIYFNKKNESIRVPKMEWKSNENTWFIYQDIEDDEIELLPVNKNGTEKVWLWGIDRTRSSLDDLKVTQNSDGAEVYRKKFLNEEGILPRTWWDKAAYSARDNGSAAISNLLETSQLSIFQNQYSLLKIR